MEKRWDMMEDLDRRLAKLALVLTPSRGSEQGQLHQPAQAPTPFLPTLAAADIDESSTSDLVVAVQLMLDRVKMSQARMPLKDSIY